MYLDDPTNEIVGVGSNTGDKSTMNRLNGLFKFTSGLVLSGDI
jgi:hypothetical protein